MEQCCLSFAMLPVFCAVSTVNSAHSSVDCFVINKNLKNVQLQDNEHSGPDSEMMHCVTEVIARQLLCMCVCVHT